MAMSKLSAAGRYDPLHMAEFDPSTHPHRRFNPLIKEYVLVSPHRTKRPWLGQLEPPQATTLPKYDPACYLCPGNSRTSGQKQPVYENTHSFENDFAAVLPVAPEAPTPLHPLMTVEPVHGACDVIIFHPRHDLTMSRLQPKEIEQVIEEWIRIYVMRGTQEGIKYVQLFENKGAMMGCSNPHPHGQSWAHSFVPTIPAQELRSLKQYALTGSQVSEAPKGPGGTSNVFGNICQIGVYFASDRPCLLCEYAHAEVKVAKDEGRVVVSNNHWVALVPWWATWPFEILLLPYRRHIAALDELEEEEKQAFAEILSKVTRRYDNLFSCSFAYSMGIHQRPVPVPKGSTHPVDDEKQFAHLHLHFDPPLLRSAKIRING